MSKIPKAKMPPLIIPESIKKDADYVIKLEANLEEIAKFLRDIKPAIGTCFPATAKLASDLLAKLEGAES